MTDSKIMHPSRSALTRWHSYIYLDCHPSSQYMGTWYDIESYPQAFQDGTCATATYTLTDDGVSVYNTQVINQLLDNVNATAVPAGNDGQAKLIVTFPIAGTDCKYIY